MTSPLTHTDTPRPASVGRDFRRAGGSESSAGADSASHQASGTITPAIIVLAGARDGAGLASRLRVSVGRLYRRLRAHGHTNTEAIPIGLLCALDRLYRRGELSPRELASAEQLQPPATTRIINALAGSGLISRHTDPANQRQAILRITAARVELLTAQTTQTSTRELWLNQRLATLTSQERQALTQAIPIINGIVGR
jgi:DNA-binding MarR family transcriptional regulator